MSATPRHEFLVGLHVTDQESYTRYRAAMTPLLEAVGGRFRCDFTVDRMLKGPAGEGPALNRVFVISFPDAATGEAFFQGAEYVAAKERFFEPAVDRVEILAEFDHPSA